MSQQNQLAVEIPAADLQNISKLISDLHAALAPFVITLSAEDRRGMLKMSDKSVSFVQKTLDYCNTNPEFIPAFLSVPDMRVDINALSQLRPLLNQLQQITDNVDDTLMLSGSEAYAAALLYYNNVKQAQKANVPNAKTIYDDLSQRFVNRTSVAAVTPQTAKP